VTADAEDEESSKLAKKARKALDKGSTEDATVLKSP